MLTWQPGACVSATVALGAVGEAGGWLGLIPLEASHWGSSLSGAGSHRALPTFPAEGHHRSSERSSPGAQGVEQTSPWQALNSPGGDLGPLPASSPAGRWPLVLSAPVSGAFPASAGSSQWLTQWVFAGLPSSAHPALLSTAFLSG